ncbi:hypothetical protein ARMSODRAFT_449516 [Armillaria solidipes]|uniref:F-box domain-containing protein n=1 Tax=Armillaria solidipes TaxID=1076256 RepID=A0A2H3BM91_9AGAR|nr:hypothetical protein ARMSODRAFT_449516 [Armillaria solidipes]
MDFSSRLPLELLQKVFRHYLSDRAIPLQSFDHSDGLWVLGQVNSTWRCATLSDASFWSSINAIFTHPRDLPLAPSQSNAGNLPAPRPAASSDREEENSRIIYMPTVSNGVVESLAYILSRSRVVPLSLSLHFPIERSARTIPSTWRTFFSLLIAESSRFQSLYLVAPTAIWEDFSRIPPTRLPLLRKLHATFEKGSVLIPVISCCPSIINLKIGLHYDTPDISHFNGNSVHMPQLHHLAIRAPSFLDSITAPNLNSLSLVDSTIHVPPPRPLSLRLGDFLHRSKCVLTAFDLFWHGTLDELFIILSSMPTLESLSCHNDLDMAFYERMKSPSSILPRLRAFSLQPSTSTASRLLRALLSDAHADATPVIDMVESRLAGGVLESVNIGCLVVKILGKRAKKRLAALNALPQVRVEIEQSFA